MNFYEMHPFQVDALRLRLEEKDAMLNKKSKQIQEVSEEKGTLGGEIHDLKDMLDVKERKVNVLQKKVNAKACDHSLAPRVSSHFHLSNVDGTVRQCLSLAKCSKTSFTKYPSV